MVNVALIIQARMGSSRLPGKSMMDLAGEPLVGRIIERVKRCHNLDRIVLAIPDNFQNDSLALLGERHGITVFKGSETDLISRFLAAGKTVQADLIVRLPADNVAPEPVEIDRIVKFHRGLGRPGFSTNLAQIRGSGYPDGIGAEVFDYILLEQALARDPSQEKHEHIHLNFYNYEKDEAVDETWCPVAAPVCPKEYARPDIVLDVNTESQLADMRALYEYMMPRNPDFSIEDIVYWHDNIRENPMEKPLIEDPDK